MKRKAGDSDEPEPSGTSSAQSEKKRKADGGAIPIATRRTTQSQKSCLSIEMIAKVASFANYGDDLMSICVAVGPTDANIVRHVCLRNNLNYLRHVLERTIARKRNGGRFRFHSGKRRIKEWMRVNSDWRRHCTKERVVDAKYCKASFQDEHNEGKVMYSSDPLIIFNNPAVAIEFHAIGILKHLVESVGMDINAYSWTSFASHKHAHLLSVTNTKSLQYLLSRNELNVCAPTELDSRTLSWYTLFTHAPCDIFKLIVHHESFNVNGRNEHNESRLSHLLMAAIFCVEIESTVSLELRLRNLQCMLDAGADPEQGAATGFTDRTILQFLHARSKQAEGSFRANAWKRVIAVMENAVAARNEIGGN